MIRRVRQRRRMGVPSRAPPRSAPGRPARSPLHSPRDVPPDAHRLPPPAVHAAARTPERPALTYKGETITYAEVWRRGGTRGGPARATSGCARGDRVAIYLEKRIETVVAMFAASAAGGVFVPINHVLKPPQVGHILADSGARVLVTSADRLAQLAPILAGDGGRARHRRRRRASARALGRRHRPLAGPTPGQTAGGRPPASTPIDVDPAAILYTSGSTGKPKGVVLSHRNLIVGAESVSTYLDNTRDDVILSVLPLSFDAGLSQVTTAFAVGAHCVLMNYLLPREVAQALRAARRHRPHVRAAAVAAARRRAVAGGGGAAACATSPTPAGGCRARRSTGFAAIFTRRGPLPHVRPHRGVPLHLPRPRRGRPPARLDRQGDPQRRDPRAAPGRHASARPARRASSSTAARWSRSATGTTRCAPPSATARSSSPGQEWRTPEMAVWSGDTVVADEEGFLYFVGRARRHDQDVGLPGQPHRDRGGRLQHRAGARRRRGRRRRSGTRPADRPGRQPPRDTELDVGSAHDGAAPAAAALHGPVARSTSATSCPAPPTASSTAT